MTVIIIPNGPYSPFSSSGHEEDQVFPFASIQDRRTLWARWCTDMFHRCCSWRRISNVQTWNFDRRSTGRRDLEGRGVAYSSMVSSVVCAFDIVYIDLPSALAGH